MFGVSSCLPTGLANRFEIIVSREDSLVLPLKQNYQFSLLFLFAITIVVALGMAFFYERYEPQDQQINVVVEDEVLVYEIETASYGIHQEGNTWFLTVVCRSARNGDLSPVDCKLEFSVAFARNPEDLIVRGSRFELPVYDQEHGNMNFFYFFGFGDIEEGVFEIVYVGKDCMYATLEANGGTLFVHAMFEKSDSISRSFD